MYCCDGVRYDVGGFAEVLFDRPRLIVARVHTPQRVVSQTRKLSGSYRTTPHHSFLRRRGTE